MGELDPQLTGAMPAALGLVSAPCGTAAAETAHGYSSAQVAEAPHVPADVLHAAALLGEHGGRLLELYDELVQQR